MSKYLKVALVAELDIKYLNTKKKRRQPQNYKNSTYYILNLNKINIQNIKHVLIYFMVYI